MIHKDPMHRDQDNGLDGYARIPLSALSSVRLRHLVSEVDSTIAVSERESGGAIPTTGITEWIGSWRDITISVGWDWTVLADKIVLLHPSEIRTNIQLVGENGCPERLSIARLHLLFWIESHPWQQNANDALSQEAFAS